MNDAWLGADEERYKFFSWIIRWYIWNFEEMAISYKLSISVFYISAILNCKLLIRLVFRYYRQIIAFCICIHCNVKIYPIPALWNTRPHEIWFAILRRTIKFPKISILKILIYFGCIRPNLNYYYFKKKSIIIRE
jgi:hypothetical protein